MIIMFVATEINYQHVKEHIDLTLKDLPIIVDQCSELVLKEQNFFEAHGHQWLPKHKDRPSRKRNNPEVGVQSGGRLCFDHSHSTLQTRISYLQLSIILSNGIRRGSEGVNSSTHWMRPYSLLDRAFFMNVVSHDCFFKHNEPDS